MTRLICWFRGHRLARISDQTETGDSWSYVCLRCPWTEK